MEDKYYVPEIEEFHLGFEYEYIGEFYLKDEFDAVKPSWSKTKFSDVWSSGSGTELENISRLIGFGHIRVKCLSREDRESLGWQLINDLYYYDVKRIESRDNEYFMDDKFYPFPDYEMYFSSEDSHLIILDFNRDIVFQGTIKNRSELSRLMKQINIK